MTIEPWRLGRKNRKRTTLPWFPADQSKEKRIPRQPKRAQQIAKLRLFVWDMMRWTYTQRSMGMVNRYWMKHIAWCLTKRRLSTPTRELAGYCWECLRQHFSHRMRSDRLRRSPLQRNWQATAESVYANTSAKTQPLHHRQMRTCENMPELC